MKIIFLAHNCNVPFIENEIHELSRNNIVTELIIYTDNKVNRTSLLTNPKIRVNYYPTAADVSGTFNIYAVWLREILSNPASYKSFDKCRKAFSYLRNESRKAMHIFKSGVHEDAVLISYWAASEALILSLLKRSGLRNLMLTRMHAFDIYEEFDNHGHIAWRWLMNNHLDRFITICRHGEHYFKNKYPALSDKVSTHYLGIEHVENSPLNRFPVKGNRIVSCGWVGHRKNLNRIFSSLKNEVNLEWVHIGGGEEFEALKTLVSDNNKSLKVDLKGSFSNSEILDFYRSEPVTCFISLSKSEGLPVSMMEAMAFGIPVVSTDVGGCSEIVNENTGVLLPENYTDEDVRSAIKTCAEKFATVEARKLIQDECRRKFDAKTNYSKFVDFLKVENEKHWQKLNESQ